MDAKRSSRAEDARAVSDIAADWLARELSARFSARDRQALQTWLDADVAHAEAYAAARAAYDAAGDAASHPEALAMRRAALQRASEKPPRRIWVAGGFAIAACLLLALVLSPERGGLDGGARQPESGQETAQVERMRDHYVTRVGERLSAMLDDGSTVTLNTASEVRIRYGTEARRVELVRGQALFSVAHRPDWPFEVVAGDQTVRALGTEFDVRLNGRSMEVVLVEGRVAVGSAQRIAAGDLTRAIELEAGERLVAARGATQVVAIDAETATSWRRGRVSFSETALPEAIAEINRYRARPLVIRDPRVAALTLSGTYRTADAMSFEDALQATLAVGHRTGANGEVVLMWRDRNNSDAER